MCKVGKGVAFFIALLAMLTGSHATQASGIESLAWLPQLSTNIKQLQPDKRCPQNQLQDLGVDKNNDHIEIKINALHWDLNCIPESAATNPPFSKKEKKQQAQFLIAQLSALPSFTFTVNHLELQIPLLNRLFVSSLLIEKTQSAVTATLKSDLLNVQATLLLESKKLRLDTHVDLPKIAHYFPLPNELARYLNNNLMLHYDSDLNHWHQGDFDISWQGGLVNVSDALSFSMSGHIDLLEEQVTLSKFLLDLQQIDLQLSEQQNWKAGSITLSNVNSAYFDYSNQEIEGLALDLRVASSSLITRVERGKSKRIRVDQQKLPSLQIQSMIGGQKDKLQLDWQLRSLNQLLDGELSLTNNVVAFQVAKNSININSLLEGLGNYIEQAGLIDIESGEVIVDLNAQYKRHQQSLVFDGALVSTEIAGKKEDILFDGMQFNSQFSYFIDAQNRVTIKEDKQQLKIKNLFVGVPIQALKIDARMQDLDPVVDHFKARLLGGRVDFNDFRINAPSQTTIKLSGISFAELIRYSAYPEIQGKGLLDGVLPLTLTDNGPEIEEGSIFARAPGGFIKVPENTVIKAMGRANPAFSLTMQLLSNFQFDTMQGRIGSTSDGESDLNVEIKGISPTVSGTQPINFNYSHSENILKLLKSLRFNDELLRDIKERY